MAAPTEAADAAESPHPVSVWPGVSVVMPVRDEERHLAGAVHHVLAQDYPGELEVVIAVGPSRDRTAEIAADLAARDPRVRVVDNPSGRTAAALNTAIASSRLPVIVRVDGHGMLSPGYIRTAVETLERTGADNVGGLMAAEGETDFEKAVAAAMTSPLGVGSARFHTGGAAGPVDTVYLGVFRRSTVEALGGYDEAFVRAQDWELNHRIRLRGGLVWFTPELRVSYRPRPTMRALSRQYFEYGRWRRVVAHQHDGTLNLRYLAPPAAVTAIAAGTLAGLLGRRVGFVLPGAYAAGITVAGLTIGRGLPWRSRAALPAVLATMHGSWGVGFLTSPRRLREQVAASGEAPDAEAGGASALGYPGRRPAMIRREQQRPRSLARRRKGTS